MQANRSAIGARVRLTVEGPDGTREIHRVVGTGGVFGASSLQLEVGLGEATAIREVRVTWPGSGLTDVHRDLEMERVWRIREGDPAPKAVEVRPFTLPR